MDILTVVLYVGVFILIFYFLMVRPQKMEQERRMKMLQSICVGSKVETVSRLYGEVVGVENEDLVLNVAVNGSCKVKIHREGVARVIGGEGESKSAETKEIADENKN